MGSPGRRRRRRLPRHIVVLLTLIALNIVVGLLVVGTAGFLSQHHRLIDDEGVRLCSHAATRSWGLEVATTRFVDDNTLELQLRARRDDPELRAAAGTYRCRFRLDDETLVVQESWRVR